MKNITAYDNEVHCDGLVATKEADIVPVAQGPPARNRRPPAGCSRRKALIARDGPRSARLFVMRQGSEQVEGRQREAVWDWSGSWRGWRSSDSLNEKQSGSPLSSPTSWVTSAWRRHAIELRRSTCRRQLTRSPVSSLRASVRFNCAFGLLRRARAASISRRRPPRTCSAPNFASAPAIAQRGHGAV